MSVKSGKFDGYQEGFRELNSFWGRIDEVENAINEYSEVALSFAEAPLEDVLEKIKAFEPSVSVIGQIKAGKSTLMNAILGETNLLPSDVNPWTSVITALHLNSRHRPLNTRAVFRFFDQGEWDRLVATGGRLGEMANRSGFEREADEVKAQVAEMRETTEARLGDEFHELLGSSHTYPDLDHDTIDRYICYGDPDDLEDGATEGVYADITKTADLYIDLPHLPKGLCLRDTPGVNDTFMMREQITLNAISDSRVCVVVLSAHQALSTMDLALLRIICSVDAREVLIFVNRIDELEDPEAEQANIRASIQKTLTRLGVGNSIDILFGSGYWANFAISNQDTMLEASKASLARIFDGDDTDDIETLRQRAMEASGVRELLKAIAQRVIDGPGEAFLKDIKNELDNIIEMSETVESVADSGGANINVSPVELKVKLADLRDKCLNGFDERAKELSDNLRERLGRAQENFVESALSALQAQIDTFGEAGTWNHDPTSLRMMMKTAFLSSCAKLRREGEGAFDDILDGIQEILENDMFVFREGSSIEFPEQAQHKAPTVLARTLSLDLQGSWWRKHWRFGRKNAAVKRYRSAIVAETAPLIDDLITGFFDPAVSATRDIVERFAFDQGEFCQAILEHAAKGVTKTESEDDETASILQRLSA
ncbi:dynamin family protein [Vannielia litorea]|uniref:dynamin family protein n=1 Tax=Vannielia litorea TaxID=1217970 RepID=UPI001C96F981|nr:dynamin family protein [Vannielia litorea]MBY6154367.1 dynamin family protein [Vannielia litorea]